MRWSKKWGNCQVIRRLCGLSISMKKDELEVFFSICHRVLPIEVVKTWNTNAQTHNSLRWTNKFFQRFVVQHLLDLLPSTTVSRRWSLGFHAIERSERIHSCDRPLLDVVPISSFFSWNLYVICGRCSTQLYTWFPTKSKKKNSFLSPLFWREWKQGIKGMPGTYLSHMPQCLPPGEAHIERWPKWNHLLNFCP